MVTGIEKVWAVKGRLFERSLMFKNGYEIRGTAGSSSNIEHLYVPDPEPDTSLPSSFSQPNEGDIHISVNVN